MAALSPSRILKFTARISAVLICANFLFQLARSGSGGSAASGDRHPMDAGKRDAAVAAAAVESRLSAASPHRAAADQGAAGSRPGAAAAVGRQQQPVAPAKKAGDSIAATPARGSAAAAAAAAVRTAGEGEFVEQAHSACLSPPPPTVSGGAGATCRTASKRIRIPKPLADVIESSGRRAAASLDDIDIERSLVFVTGASANHFLESLALIENVQKHHPRRPVFYWDIGLTAAQAANVSALCGVTYRKFDFSRFPPHVRSLVTYAFKPLCILQSFDEHRVVWWLDASVRFQSGDLASAVAKAREHRGLLTFLGPGHYVFEATHRQTFDYLATDPERLMTTRCVTGASFIVANTRELFERVLRWYYRCALDVRCIAPVLRPTACQFSKDHRSYANCHRFDQSVLNILSANMWQFDARMHATRELNFTLKRGTSGTGSARYCPRKP